MILFRNCETLWVLAHLKLDQEKRLFIFAPMRNLKFKIVFSVLRFADSLLEVPNDTPNQQSVLWLKPTLHGSRTTKLNSAHASAKQRSIISLLNPLFIADLTHMLWAQLPSQTFLGITGRECCFWPLSNYTRNPVLLVTNDHLPKSLLFPDIKRNPGCLRKTMSIIHPLCCLNMTPCPN